MPDIKISDLTAATSASGSMQMEVNDSGTSKRITVDQVKAYAVSDGSITAAKLGTDSVTTDKIANGAVTPAKLSTGAPVWTTDGKVGIGTGSPSNALDVVATEPFVKVSTSSSGLSAFYQATNPQGSFYAGKDRDGSAGLWGNAGEYVIAGTGNYPMDFWTNGTKRLSITGGGNINIPGTGRRITGDFSNTTASNKVIFQTTTTNDGTTICAMPNGTNKYAGIQIYNSSDPDNASAMIINTNVAGTFVNFNSSQTGTGSYLPIQILTNNLVQARFQNNGNFEFNSGYGSSATAYGCRSWVNFNGTGTVAIRASGNVSSITDNGTGDYTVNFTTAMPDTNYAATVAGSESTGGSNNLFHHATLYRPSNPFAAGSVRIRTGAADSGNSIDFNYVTAMIVR